MYFLEEEHYQNKLIRIKFASDHLLKKEIKYSLIKIPCKFNFRIRQFGGKKINRDHERENINHVVLI